LQRGAAIQQQQTLSPRTPPLLKTRHLTAASTEGPNITVISDPSPEELDQLDFSSSSSEDCKVPPPHSSSSSLLEASFFNIQRILY